MYVYVMYMCVSLYLYILTNSLYKYVISIVEITTWIDIIFLMLVWNNNNSIWHNNNWLVRPTRKCSSYCAHVTDKHTGTPRIVIIVTNRVIDSYQWVCCSDQPGGIAITTMTGR